MSNNNRTHGNRELRKGDNKMEAKETNLGSRQVKFVTKVKTVDLNKFMDELYQLKINDEELLSIYDSIKYHGFERKNILEDLYSRFNSNLKILVEIIILCALRGPRKACDIKMSNGRSLSEMNIPASNGKGSKGLTCSRITAATADLAAFYLKRLKIPKKISSIECPAWLQFPSAGSITMPDKIRRMHLEFTKLFAVKIGGDHNEQIYQQMEDNSYLGDKLELFS